MTLQIVQQVETARAGTYMSETTAIHTHARAHQRTHTPVGIHRNEWLTLDIKRNRAHSFLCGKKQYEVQILKMCVTLPT